MRRAAPAVTSRSCWPAAGRCSASTTPAPTWPTPERSSLNVPTEKHDLQDLPYEDEFDGVMCLEAMEFVPPEDWPGVVERFRRALHPGGRLYLSVELAPADRVRALSEEARRRATR